MKKILLIVGFVFCDQFLLAPPAMEISDFQQQGGSKSQGFVEVSGQRKAIASQGQFVQARQGVGVDSNFGGAGTQDVQVAKPFGEMQIAKPLDNQIDFGGQSQIPVARRVDFQEAAIARPVSDGLGSVDMAKSSDQSTQQNQQSAGDQKYNSLVALGLKKYQTATPGELRASINTSALGNALTVLVDPASSAVKQADAVNVINDIRAKVEVTKSFVDAAGLDSYDILQQSTSLFSGIAQEPTVRDSAEQRDLAVNLLMEQRNSLGESFQNSLKLLQSTATPEQITQAKAFIQSKIGSRNSAELFKDSRVREDYNVFINDLAQLRDGVHDPKQLASFLEQKLNLQPGELISSPISVQASMKLEALYQTLDLIAVKKGANVSGSDQAGTFMNRMRGPRLSNEQQVKDLVSGIRQFEPMVKTVLEEQLLNNSTDKQAILLTTQSHFMYITMGRAMNELQAIQFAPAE